MWPQMKLRAIVTLLLSELERLKEDFRDDTGLNSLCVCTEPLSLQVITDVSTVHWSGLELGSEAQMDRKLLWRILSLSAS